MQDTLKTDSIEIQKDLEFISQHGGLPIKYDIYMSKDDIKDSKLCIHTNTIIQIAHGMVEHKERYEWFCKQLARHGYVVAISDHRGHGKSIDNNHAWGEMGGLNNSTNEFDGFQKAIDDMYHLTQLLKDKFANYKFVLIGHSMGSLLSRGYLKKYGNVLDALILSGSPAHNPLLSVGVLMAKFFKAINANELGKNVINSLSFGGFNKPFEKYDSNSVHSTGEFAWLNRDSQGVNAYKTDPACQFVFSLDSFIALFNGTLWVRTPLDNDSPLSNKDLKKPPIFIISGDHDSCGNFGKGVIEISNNFQKYGFDTTLKLYSEARHEIFQEINKEEVVEDILQWLKAHIDIESK